MKFKNFSTHIVPVTNFLLVFLIILSIIGFILIFFLSPNDTKYELQVEPTHIEKEDEKNYQDDIIGTEHY